MLHAPETYFMRVSIHDARSLLEPPERLPQYQGTPTDDDDDEQFSTQWLAKLDQGTRPTRTEIRAARSLYDVRRTFKGVIKPPTDDRQYSVFNYNFFFAYQGIFENKVIIPLRVVSEYADAGLPEHDAYVASAYRELWIEIESRMTTSHLLPWVRAEALSKDDAELMHGLLHRLAGGIFRRSEAIGAFLEKHNLVEFQTRHESSLPVSGEDSGPISRMDAWADTTSADPQATPWVVDDDALQTMSILSGDY